MNLDNLNLYVCIILIKKLEIKVESLILSIFDD